MTAISKGEFGLIEQIKTLFSGLNSGLVEGIGDDCAVMTSDGNLSVVTTDMLIEDVHFLRDATTPYMIGRKSLAVNLSDVAAMGAQPIASLLSVALPHDCQGEWAEEFMRGYHDISKQYHVPLIGGDTTSSKGAIAINVVALGSVTANCVKRRSSAVVGDKILVTGTLGESAAGLRDILARKTETPLAQIHKNPTPCVHEGVWLGKQQAVRAMMDLSDGLASDIKHILNLSKVGAAVDITKVPFVTTIEDAVCGGEDYKLLLTADSDQCDALCRAFESQFGYALTVVGEIIDKSGSLEWYDQEQVITPDWVGFRHF